MAVNTSIKKEERSQVNNLTTHLKKTEKGKQIKLQASRRKKIMKVREEINKIDRSKQVDIVIETKNFF